MSLTTYFLSTNKCLSFSQHQSYNNCEGDEVVVNYYNCDDKDSNSSDSLTIINISSSLINSGTYGQIFLLTKTAIVEGDNDVVKQTIIRKRCQFQRGSDYFSPDFLNELAIYSLIKGVTNIVGCYGADYSLNEYDKLEENYHNSASLYLEPMKCSLYHFDSHFINSSSSSSKLAILPSLISQVSSALAALHSLHLLHSDLRPSNILVSLTDDGSFIFKLADFGLTGFRGRLDELNLVGGIMHSRPPEVLVGKCVDQYDYCKVDIWALGLCCLQFLTGKHPLAADEHEDANELDEETMLLRCCDLATSDSDFTNHDEVEGGLDVGRLLSTSSGWQSLTNDDNHNRLIADVYRMLRFDYRQRPTAAELVKLYRGDGDNLTATVSTISDLPVSYPHNYDIWWLVRAYTNDIAVVCLSYEICLRLLSSPTTAWSSRSLVANVVCLVKQYLTIEMNDIDLYGKLSGCHDNQQFLAQIL